MAQPDLIAQKLLATDPRIGFGDSGVAGSEVPPLDMRGFQIQADIAAQKAKAIADKRKADEERINKFNWVDVNGKHTPAYEKAKGQFNAVAAHMLDSGQVDIPRLSQMNAEINSFAEVGDNEHKTYLNDIDKTIPDYASSYENNEYNQGEATKLGNVSYNATPIGAYHSTMQRVNKYGQTEDVSIYDPKANPDLYNIEAAADNFTNNYKSLGLNQFQNLSEQEKGALTTVIKNVQNGIYMKKGADGKWVPGVSDEVLSNYIDHGAVKDYYAHKTLPAYYQADAALIKSDPSRFPQYIGLTEEQIRQSLKEQGDPIRNNLRQDDLVKDIARKDLESRNKQSVEKEYRATYDEDSAINGIGNNDAIGTAVEFNGQRNFNVAAPTSPGSKPIIRNGWVPSTLHLEQSKLKPINVSAQNIADVETNGAFADVLNDKLLSDKYVSGVPFKPTGVSLLPVGSDGKIKVLSEEKIRKEPGIKYVPYVNGTVTIDMNDVDKNSEEYKKKIADAQASGEDIKEVGKNIYQYTVLIPYNEASKQMEANYGITQEQVDSKLYNPSLNLQNLKSNTLNKDPYGILE